MKKFFKILGWMLLIGIILGTFVFLFKKSQSVPTTYAIDTVRMGDSIESKTVVTGTIGPRDEVLIKPQMSGIIAELLHKAGDQVEVGQVIARISVVPDMMQLSSADARVKTARIAYEKAHEVYLRDKSLYDRGVIAVEEFQTSQATYLQTKTDMATAQDALDIVRTGVSKTAAKQSTTLVRSTVTGKILDIPVKVGNSVIQSNTFNEGTTIATVADMNDLIFVGNVDESEVGKIHVGSELRITVGAIGTITFPATIEYISPKGTTVNDATLFQIKAAVKIPLDQNIRAGYSANAEVVLQSAYGIMTIAESCVRTDEGKAYVEVITAEKPELKTERRDVTLGISDGVKVQILSGLKAGQRIKGNAIAQE